MPCTRVSPPCWAVARGLEAYEFLSGEDAYKRRWATADRTLVDLAAYAPRPLLRAVLRARDRRDARRR